MKTIAIISTFLAALAFAAPTRRQDSQVSYRVSDLSDPSNPKYADTTTPVNGPFITFDMDNSLVSNNDHGLNRDGFVYATRLDVTSPLDGITCHLINDQKQELAVLTTDNYGADFDGNEDPNNNPAAYADKYSLQCYSN